mmetsp:Transcript_8063/g.15875  ORF Transcript_8063/g.15875 Transcript_8063/m.15875 type:complete len:126 (-) Transcript_8063:10082-10459(-)
MILTSIKMLSEDQMYHAKVFIRSYADAFACLEEAARKETTFKHYRTFYVQLKKSQDANEIQIDEEKVLPGKSFSGSYFHKLFNFSRESITRYFPSQPSSCEDLSLQLEAMASDLKKRVSEARQKS